VYPNPANEQLFIQLDENDTYETVQILDLNGKLLLNQLTENQTSLRLDVSGLPAGLYLLRVQGQNSFSFQKFVKN
jgi:hypothetical protein